MKTKKTKKLERAIYRTTRKTGVFGCFEVTLGIFGRERVDYMTYESAEKVFRCYEVKSSLADFRSPAALSFVGHYNYYVMPQELYEKVKDEIPAGIGCYVKRGPACECVKRARRRKLQPHMPCKVLMESMIRSLYREAEKVMDA